MPKAFKTFKMRTAYPGIDANLDAYTSPEGHRQHHRRRLQDFIEKPSTKKNLWKVGFAVLPGLLGPLEVESLLEELPHYVQDGPAVNMDRQSPTCP
eukprot:Skav229207  [mRNA]  locus=scaffold2439:75295:75964:+ [translate_table: standard]